MPLYPAGLTTEGVYENKEIFVNFVVLIAIVIVHSLPYIAKYKAWSLQLPNVLNFAFDFATFLWVYLALFLGGSESIHHICIHVYIFGKTHKIHCKYCWSINILSLDHDAHA